MADLANTGSLQIRDVSKMFGPFRAVDGVTLDIERGEFLTLLGPSGSGKTTLLMMIAGFLDITQGDIALDGASIADEMLDLVQLQEFADRKPTQLSGGQQQRVALARALCFAPPVLLLDEPLGALDKKLRVEVQEQLKDIHRRVGTTFIYVTHDQEEALSMSDRIVIMRDGAIEQVGTPVELYERPATKFAASFLGKSNFITQGDKTYALRPEKIDLRLGQGGSDARVSGTIRSITYFGSMQRIIVDSVQGDEIEVDIDVWRNQEALTEGAKVDLLWQEAAAVELHDT